MYGELFAFLAMLLFATNILITKAASTRLDVSVGFGISVAMNLVFAMLAFAVQLGLRADAPAWNAYGVLMFVLAGIAATYLGRWFFFGAIALLGSAKASLFHISSPAFTAVIAWMFLGEALSPWTAVAIVATTAGLFLVSLPPGGVRALLAPPVEAKHDATGRMQRLLAGGFAIGLGATFAYAVGGVLRGAAVRAWNEPILGAMLGAAAALACHALIGAEKRLQELRALPTADRVGVRLYVLSGMLTICAQISMIVSMLYIPIGVATVITLCTPLVVIPASYVLSSKRDRLSPVTLLGASITMAGVLAIVLR